MGGVQTLSSSRIPAFAIGSISLYTDHQARGNSPHSFLNTANVSSFLMVALMTTCRAGFWENSQANSATKKGIAAPSYVFPPVAISFQRHQHGGGEGTDHIGAHHQIDSLGTLAGARPRPLRNPHRVAEGIQRHVLGQGLTHSLVAVGGQDPGHAQARGNERYQARARPQL